MKKIALALSLSSSILLANPIEYIDSVGFNIGISQIDYDKKDITGSITLNEIDKSAMSYDLFLNLKTKRDDVKIQIDYNYQNSDDVNMNSLLLGLNRYFQYKELKPYIGAVVGYGVLSWDKNPLNGTKSNDEEATSLIGGAQIGVQYPITESIDVNLNTRVLFHNYKTELEPIINTTKSEIKHDMSSSVGFGLVYRF